MPQDGSHAVSVVAAAKHAAAKAALDDSSDDDGQQELGGHVSQSGIGKPKRWSWNATEAYFVNILIKTCVEVIECGKTMSMPEIHCDVMTIWHRRFAFISQYSLDLIIIYLQ